ncbi:MAG TPA: serine protease [Candidatus Nanoarchaeia archaeon]|nr:serine protease [Candidatus Nanoarchaeia archaeon]
MGLNQAMLTFFLGAAMYLAPMQNYNAPKTSQQAESAVAGYSGYAKSNISKKLVYELQPEIKRDVIHSLYESIAPILTKVTYEKNERNSEGIEELVKKENQSQGSGILLNGNYVLTACHVINPLFFYNQEIRDSFKQQKIPLLDSLLLKEIKTEPFVVINDKEYALNHVVEGYAEDFSLMKINAPLKFKPYKFGIGKSRELQLGDFVYVVGNGHTLGVDLRMTRVTKPIDNEGFFCISQGSIAGGDSGGFVFAVDKQGMPEFVGIITQVRGSPNSVSQWYGYVKAIDPIMEKIRQHNPKIDDEWKAYALKKR